MLGWSSRGEPEQNWLYQEIQEAESPPPKESPFFAIYPFPGKDKKGRFFIPKNKIQFSLRQYSSPQYSKREDFPNRNEWNSLVEKALIEIRNRRLQKVVLARKTVLTFANPIDPLSVFSSLFEKRKNATVFLFAPQKGKAFIGASPEMLYLRKGRFITTEALAGTAPLSDPFDCRTSKNQKELHWVKKFITERLIPISQTINIGEDKIIETSRLQHLYCQFSAHLKNGIGDEDILSSLHPTPAIGGTPQQSAIHFIRGYEPFDREFYASALGFFSKEEAEVVVGIRSAFIEGCQMHLYAGAGIVEDSDPRREWDELEQKISLYI